MGMLYVYMYIKVLSLNTTKVKKVEIKDYTKVSCVQK